MFWANLHAKTIMWFQNGKLRHELILTFRLHQKLRINHTSDIHNILSRESMFKFLNEASNCNIVLLFHNFNCIQPIKSKNTTPPYKSKDSTITFVKLSTWEPSIACCSVKRFESRFHPSTMHTWTKIFDWLSMAESLHHMTKK